MQTINILDFSVANLIAAGEVVDRPASVVKELIENAIDAGAGEISVEIKRGGVGYIRVTDNGKGMSRDDAEVCILRHATSKIKDARDLDAIMTLGFRGEALAAVSSVCSLCIRTKRSQDETGTEVLCDAGRITEVNDVGTPNGTTVIVKELFANVPARRKFLKRDQSEGMACAAVVEKEAMAHPEIAFSFISDGSQRLRTAGDKKLYNAIYALLGRDFAKKLIRVDGKNEAIEVFGYIGRPDNVRANRNFQNFFINGRYVKSKTATAALEQAYSSFMESERFPVCVLNIVIHPALVDVNVHPTKLEVKFSNEKTVFDAVYLAVRNALLNDVTRPELQLGKNDVGHKAIATYNAFAPVYDRLEPEKDGQMNALGPGANGDSDQSLPAPAPAGDVPKKPYDDFSSAFDEIIRQVEEENGGKPTVTVPETPGAFRFYPGKGADEGKSVFSVGAARTNETLETRRIPTGAAESDRLPNGGLGFPFLPREGGPLSGSPDSDRSGGVRKPIAASPDDGADARSAEGFRLIGVAFGTYIFAEVGDKLLVVDKHAAHERLLFEKMKSNMTSSDKRATQLLLVPEVIRADYSEINAAIEYKEELEAAGYSFVIKENGNLIELTGLPGQVDKQTALSVFGEMLTNLSSGTGDVEVSRRNGFEKALYTASCKAAMKGNRNDGDAHVEYLISELLRLPDIRYCPHGRPVAFEIPKGSIEHKFKRS